MSLPALTYPNVNGMEYSYASIIITIGGQQFVGVTSINYNDKLTPSYTDGTSSLPLGWTRGKWESSADMEMKKYDAQQLLGAMGDGYGLKTFQVQVQYAETGMPVITDTLPAVRITEVGSSNTAGADPSKMKFTLMQLRPIQRDGLRIVPDIQNNTGA